MIKIFSEYIKNISMCIILSAIVEIILPNSNFKKYTELVMGFIVIIAVLNPVKDILFKDNSLEFEVFSRQSQIDNNSIAQQKQLYSQKQKEFIIENYKQQLKTQIFELMSKSQKLNIEDINIEVDEDFESDTFAQIQKIEVSAYNGDLNIQNSSTIKPVERVNISESTADVYSQNIERDIDTEKNLESLISDFYKLDKDNIYIIVHRK